MPSALFMSRATLIPAVRSGRMAPAVIDDKVRRLLRVALENHFLDRPQRDDSIPIYDPASDAVALSSAQESIVLLKNDGELLPLDRNRLRSVAVIGPDAWPAVAAGGGSSQVTPFKAESLVAALGSQLGSAVRVNYAAGVKDFHQVAQGTPWTQDQEGSAAGLRVETFEGPEFSGRAQEDSIDQIKYFSADIWGRDRPALHACRISGYYLPPVTGRYFVLAQASGYDAYRVLLDGQPVLEEPRRDGQSPQSTEVVLAGGRPVHVTFDYRGAGAGIAADLGIISEAEMVDSSAARLAAAADVAVVSVGFDARYESEGFDRTYALPAGQELLVRQIEAANPRTVVVLTGGGSMDLSGFVGQTRALLHTLYGGQEGGRALAQVLLGEVNPSGHLPFTFERRIQDCPALSPSCAPDAAGRVAYAEGIFVGYRFYDRAHIKPLFAFGHGLSYTHFSFSHLSVEAGPVVSFDVTNTGERSGAAVAQVYVGDPSATVPRPVKELKRFERVPLTPGQTRRLRFHLDQRALAYWDVTKHGWKVDPGRFVVYVGDSSDHLPLQAGFAVP